MTFNKVVMVGYLTRDCELRYTPKGTAVAQCAIALNRRWKNDAGENQDEVTFVDFTAWGKTAETMTQYLRKGSPCLIEGRLKQDMWEDRTTGKTRSKLTVVVETFQFLEPAVGYRAESGRPKSEKLDAAPAVDDPGAIADDIPFSRILANAWRGVMRHAVKFLCSP